MARFEMNLLMAVQTSDDEITTVQHDIMCFCEDASDANDIRQKAHQIISEMMQDEEGEVLFGSADIELKDTMLNITFRNKNHDEEDILSLMSMILDGDESTMH